MINAPRTRYAALLYGFRRQMIQMSQEYLESVYGAPPLDPRALVGTVVRHQGRPFRVEGFDLSTGMYVLGELEEHPTEAEE